jgi:hypothetical protein
MTYRMIFLPYSAVTLNTWPNPGKRNEIHSKKFSRWRYLALAVTRSGRARRWDPLLSYTQSNNIANKADMRWREH